MSLVPLISSVRKDHKDTLSLTRKTYLGRLMLTGCQTYKSYSTKCKSPTQIENAINGEASQAEDREKRSANKDIPAGRLHQRRPLEYPALTGANTTLYN